MFQSIGTEMAWQRRSIVAIAIVVAAIMFGLWSTFALRTASLSYAEAALRRRDYDEAERLAVKAAPRLSRPGEAWFLAARAAKNDGRPRDALRHLSNLSDRDNEAFLGRMIGADLCLSTLNEFSECEQWLKAAERVSPHDPRVVETLGFFLGLCGRSTEAEPYRLAMLSEGREAATMLWLLCLGDDAIENTELLSGVSPARDDSLVLLSLGRWIADRSNPQQGRELLQKAIQLNPDLVEARVRLGGLLVEAGNEPELTRLLQETRGVEWHPRLWSLRAGWCQRHGQDRAAIRCYLECLRRSPNQSRACYPIAQLLEVHGKQELGDVFRRRAEQLAAYLNAVKAVRQEFSLDRWESAVLLARELGLVLEVSGWLRLASPEWNTSEVLIQAKQWLAKQDSRVLQRTPTDLNPAYSIKLDEWPLPDFDLSTEVRSGNEVPPAVTAIRWDNVAAERGFQFVYGPVPGYSSAGPRMFEFTGGGVGVVDVDLDGWPDVWMTQGSEWPAGRSTPPTERPSASSSDQLFRNIGGERLQNVTQPAGIDEWGFGQGIAVSDVDADGFADVIVANIGHHQLWLNQGDGTFRSGGQITNDGVWNTSVGAADLSGDGLPDLYCVRYLAGHDVFTKTCPDSEGHPHSCLPQRFPAAADLILINSGDGSFIDVSADMNLKDETGKGMGVVIGRLADEGEMSIFVANDTTPNFFWTLNNSENRTQLLDVALVNGTALSGDGRSQADMGVAVDDIDGDGRLDLFVTKFFNETNTLYRQFTPGMFNDATAGSGLGESSLRLLGFGAQFLDADLDGWPDLLLTNGHIDDARHRGEAFAMRPQFYRNEGHGRFRELKSPEVGEFFATEHLGRGLARLDWNRDGREDAVISHIGTEAALLENQSNIAAHFLTITLVGHKSSREPIGAIVTATCGDRTYTKQLTAGDGYHASNQRCISFGLGAATQVDRLTVKWPSGEVTETENLPADSEWIWRESKDRPIPRPR